MCAENTNTEAVEVEQVVDLEAESAKVDAAIASGDQEKGAEAMVRYAVMINTIKPWPKSHRVKVIKIKSQ